MEQRKGTAARSYAIRGRQRLRGQETAWNYIDQFQSGDKSSGAHWTCSPYAKRKDDEESCFGEMA